MSPTFKRIDTDSLFLMIGKFLESQGITREQWLSLPQDTRTDYTIKISKIIEDNVNHRSYTETQQQDYNSIVDHNDFFIDFKAEIVCPKALFLAPKMYCYHVINDEGFSTDRIDAKGIEIVRSNSPKVFRNALKDLIKNLLKGRSDDELRKIIDNHKKHFNESKPEDVSTNMGVNNLAQYISDDFTYKKGTPFHLKGAANYHWLLNELGIAWKYEQIKEGDKVKIVYVKNNKYGIKVLSYYEYPQEFIDAGVCVDYSIMTDKYFNNKVGIILDPINKSDIVNGVGLFDDFF